VLFVDANLHFPKMTKGSSHRWVFLAQNAAPIADQNQSRSQIGARMQTGASLSGRFARIAELQQPCLLRQPKDGRFFVNPATDKGHLADDDENIYRHARRNL